MRYTLEMELGRPRHRVVELFDNPDNLSRWQPDLLAVELQSGIPGQVGATSKILYRMGSKEIEMTETVLSRNLPDEITATYQTGNPDKPACWNRVENRFIELDSNKTLWQFDCEFRCTGLMKVMCLLMPGQFKKESRKYMMQFRDFVEKS